jgi:hypothetical protein
MKIKSLKIAFIGLIAVSVLALSMATTHSVLASSSDLSQGASAAQGTSVQNVCLFTNSTCKTGVFTTIANVALFLIAAISVLMIIYGGIRYTISGGDAKNVTAAKNTIIYAVVGLVVAILAYAIVDFVILHLT